MAQYITDENSTSESARKTIDVDFNPSGDLRVHQVKMLSAHLVTLMEPLQANREGPAGSSRLAAIAITEFEKAAMVAVKALTRK